MPVTAAAIGIPIVASTIGGIISGSNQQSAAQKAQQASAQQIADATQSGSLGYGLAENSLLNQIPGATSNINSGYNQSTDYLTQGLGAQRSDLTQGGALGADAITGGQGSSLADIYGGAQSGIGYLNDAQTGVGDALNSGLSSAQSALAGRSSNAQDLLDQPGGLYGDYKASPGYASTLAAGQQAIDRINSASGGRFSGAAIKEATKYATDLTDQDYQNYVGNQNSLLSGSLGVDNNDLSANSTLAGLYGSAGSQAASTTAGLGSQAAQLAYGAGQGAAGVDTSAAGALAGIYGGTGSQLASADAGAGTALGQNASNYYGNLNNLNLGTTQQLNEYGINSGNIEASMLGANLQNNQSTIPYAGSTAAAIGNGASGLGQAAALSSVYGSSSPSYSGYNPNTLPQTQEQLDAFGGGPI